jgi:hypothetical protein
MREMYSPYFEHVSRPLHRVLSGSLIFYRLLSLGRVRKMWKVPITALKSLWTLLEISRKACLDEYVACEDLVLAKGEYRTFTTCTQWQWSDILATLATSLWPLTSSSMFQDWPCIQRTDRGSVYRSTTWCRRGWTKAGQLLKCGARMSIATLLHGPTGGGSKPGLFQNDEC